MLVGRQPLLDTDQRLAGYEIRVVGGGAVGIDALLAAVADIGRRRNDAEHIVLVEGDTELLSDAARSMLISHRIWLAVGAELGADGAAAELIRTASQEVPLVLDDPVRHPALAPLADRATVLRVHGRLTPGHLPSHVARVRRAGTRVLLTGVDTPTDRQRAADAGVDLIQGSALTTAEVLAGARLSPDTPALVRLVAMLASPHVELADVVDLVNANVTLSFQLLRLANSAAVGTRTRVDSVERAVHLLGPPTLRQLASLLLLRSGPNVPGEVARTALVRGRMCEHLGEVFGAPGPVHHTVGMLSMLDVISGVSLSGIVDSLPITEEVRAALLRREGVPGRILTVVERYEEFDWESPQIAALDPFVLADAYFRAVRDADAVLARFGDAVREAAP